jgi:hypothetical protein
MPLASKRRDAEAAPRGAAVPQGVAVPWLTVLPLSGLLAYADGFWLTSLRGATGAIERTQTPLLSWVRESTLLLPVFVVAVLVALTLGMRWFGQRVVSPRRVVATALLVVAAASVASTAWLVASSAYDYHLQARQVAMMGSMGTICVGPCLALQEHSTLTLQLRAVGYGTAILVASNLVVVTWLVALRGGRLTLGVSRAAATDGATPTGGAERVDGSRHQDLQLLLTTALLAAGLLHAAVVPAALHRSTAVGASLVLLAAVELGVAVQVMGRLRRSVLVAAAAVSVLPLLVWLYSHVVGLRSGPSAAQSSVHSVGQPLGLAYGAALPLEIAALAAVGLLVVGGGWLARPRASAHVRGIALVAVLAVTAVGLGGTGLALFNALGDTSDHSRVHVLVTPTSPVAVPPGSSAGTAT